MIHEKWRDFVKKSIVNIGSSYSVSDRRFISTMEAPAVATKSDNILTKLIKFTILTLISAWLIYLSSEYYDDMVATWDTSKLVEIKNVSLDIDRDWEEPEAIVIALNRTGLGEVARPANLEEERQRLYTDFGFDAMLSDYISLDRSLPDIRHPGCHNITYLADLPLASVIVIFYNEHLSVLLRTVHSLLNRSPPELLNEIILVNDCSTLSSLGKPLELHLAQNFAPNKVRLVRTQPHRMGLMVARNTGARAASNSSEVLIFLDSHFEVMYNWLPPLLEPIALNRRVCTCPIIDTIRFRTFEYIRHNGYLNYFDWTLWLRQMPLTAAEEREPTRPYRNFVMSGGAMAMAKDFFWELGGFDEGMQFWGAEHFEMSFKLWMCGGKLLEIPCSRMGHLYRDSSTKGNTNLYGNYGFEALNQRRLIEVWMDDVHRQHILNRSQPLRDVKDLGEIASRHAIRKRLKCKSFTWLMETVFADISRKFPMHDPPDYASGIIESLGAPGLCIDNMGSEHKTALYECAKNKTHPHPNQFYHFTWRRELRDSVRACLEADYYTDVIREWGCHATGGNQEFFYDRYTKWLIQGRARCLLANPEERRIYLKPCDTENPLMRWDFGYVNETRMQELEAEEFGEKKSSENV